MRHVLHAFEIVILKGMLNGLGKSFKMSILEHKRSLRKSTLLRMKNVDIEERLRQSRHVSQTLIASKLYKNAKRISIYLSLPSEISTRWLLEDILKEGKNLLMYRPWMYLDFSRL